MDGTADEPGARVAAYVVRTGRHGAELLVCEPVGVPGAGLRVPAGGVRAGEALERAVLRVVAAETGLVDVGVVQRVAVEDKQEAGSSGRPAGSGTQQPRRTTFLQLDAPADAAPETWTHHVHDGDPGTGPDTAAYMAELAAGTALACAFVPLPLRQPLAGDQDAWLGHIDPRWTTLIDVR